MFEAERPVFHPEPGGLLACCCTRGSDVLFWDTSSCADPDRWTVVVRHSGAVPGSGPLLGPLLGIFTRTALLPDAEAWTPPAPVPPRLTEAERRIALETGTGLDGLRLLSPPPERPYLGDGSWEGLFAELGTRLPREYLRLMDGYDAGVWSGWLRFHTQLRTGERRFLTHVGDTTAAYRQLKDGHPDWYPLALWPEPGGFLPFANSIDGDDLGWLT
ncbi:hypothetical protein [Streptomyces erythrochromogenes]|uniref:hypothetical protein n=1 Tax=Streptomyces erythrochromogenes TaxID=285574 RepID=UPI0037CE3052